MLSLLIFLANWRRVRSIVTIALIDSIIGTILGSTQGSCLPFASKTTDSPLKLTVLCSILIVDTGLTATLKFIIFPVVIPPKVPPALLVVVDSHGTMKIHILNKNKYINKTNLLIKNY